MGEETLESPSHGPRSRTDIFLFGVWAGYIVSVEGHFESIRVVGKSKFPKREDQVAHLPSIHRVLGYFFWILWVGILVSQIFQPDYDWDLDTFFYLGPQFGEGQLLFVDAFDIKLPIIPVIFWLPQALGGIIPWRLLSGLLVAIATYCLAKNLSNLLTGETSRDRALMTSGAVLVTTFSLPGAESAHISMIAASFFSGALALSISTNRAHQATWRVATVGSLITLAILIRPNYGFVALLPIALMYLRDRNLKNRRAKKTLLALIGGSTSILGLVVAPYLLAPGGLNALLDGLTAMGSFSEGRSAGFVALKQFINRETFFTYVALYSSILALPFLLIRVAKQVGFLVVAIAWTPLIMAVGLNLSFVLSHFHDHYIQLFLPIITTIVVVLALLPDSSSLKWKRLFSLTVIMLLFVSPLGDLWTGYKNYSASSPRGRVLGENRVQENLKFLEVAADYGRTFWVADSPFYHWRLGEPRLGDGHPAIARSLLSGREATWSSVVFKKYDLSQNHCNLLENSQKDLLIIEGAVDELNGYVTACLERPNSRYVEVTGKSDLLVGATLAHNFERVFLRRDLARLEFETFR